VAERDQLETYQLALSYLEHARRKLTEWDRLKAGGHLDRTQHDPVRARYAVHVREADRIVERLKREAKQAIGPLHHRLEQATREHKRLLRGMDGKNTSPKKLNERHRRLQTEIDVLRGDLAMAEAIHATEAADAVGGYIDLPLEKYARELDLPDVSTKTTAGPRRMLTPLQANLLSGAIMLALVLGAVAGLSALRTTIDAEFDAGNVSGDPRLIRVNVRNTGNRGIYLYAPWPGGTARAPSDAPKRSRAYGVSLFVREPGGEDLRLLEDSTGAWKYRGALLQPGEFVEIQPGRRSSVFLDLDVLEQQTGIVPEELAVEFSRSGGFESERFTYSLDPLDDDMR